MLRLQARTDTGAVSIAWVSQAPRIPAFQLLV